MSDPLEIISFDEDLRIEVSELQPCAATEGEEFWVCIFNNPFNHGIVRENGRSSNNGMDAESGMRYFDPFLGRLLDLVFRNY